MKNRIDIENIDPRFNDNFRRHMTAREEQSTYAPL